VSEELIREGLVRFPFRTPTLPPATHTNSYALGTADVLLVEPATPFHEEQQSFREWVLSLKAQGRSIVGVFITHHHPDHVGGLKLAVELGVPIYMHTETASRIDSVPRTHVLSDGETLVLGGPMPQCWKVLHTPGHAAGHLCLHEAAQSVLIAGDMVASEGTILIAPSDGNMREYCKQLARLHALGAELVLPAHGAPIGEPVFERTLQHRLRRESKVKDALAAVRDPQDGTLSALVRTAYADVPEALWPIARLSLESHLIKLCEDGVATMNEGRFELC
jgi:endoribonuclease LACTB2